MNSTDARAVQAWLPAMAALMLFTASCLVGVSSARAITIDTSMGNGADATVNRQATNTNYGSSDILINRYDGNPSPWHRQSYIRFDIGALAGQVANASLDIRLTYNTPGPQDNAPADPDFYDMAVYGMVDSDAGNNWSESGITWNNAPGNALATHLFTGAFQLLGVVSVAALNPGDLFTLNSAAVTDFINADTDGLVTFGLSRLSPSQASLLFATKEHLTYDAPSLNLTIVPEPSTALLLGLGLLGLGVRKERLGLGGPSSHG